MKKVYMKIEGITCQNCIDKITKELLKNKNIKEVEIKNNIATIYYDKEITYDELIDPIIKLDYYTEEDYISKKKENIKNNIKLKEFIIIFLSILAVYYLLKLIFKINIFTIMPKVNSSASYIVIFLAGLLSSLHCIGMCGSINFLAAIEKRRNKRYKRPILYNLGRLTSYTIIGFICGLIGGFFKVNDTISGIVILLASIFMIILSLNMLGILNIKLLNGLMPCAPLQTMQLYAIATSNPIKGALAMFFFCLGTIPLMFMIGFLVNILKGKKKVLLNKIASVLILILSILMLNRGLITLGIDITKIIPSNGINSIKEEDYQVVKMTLGPGNTTFKDFTVKKGIPVKLIINFDKNLENTCISSILIKDFNISKDLKPGENVIIFTPTKKGVYTYSCKMGMIIAHITVED